MQKNMANEWMNWRKLINFKQITPLGFVKKKKEKKTKAIMHGLSARSVDEWGKLGYKHPFNPTK